jgi:hypothetical protein
VRKLIVVGAGAVGAAGLAAAFLGQGVAGADTLEDVTGKYYGQAKELLAEEGLTPIVATRVGDVATDDDCVIDRIQNANFTNGTGTAASDTVYVYLNCYANVASQLRPGYSRQSQLGSAAYEAQLQAQEEAEAQQQAESEEQVTADNPGER